MFRRRRPSTARARILGWYVLLLAVALVVALVVQRSFLLAGVVADADEAIEQEVQAAGRDLAGGLHAVEHVCIGILPLFAMCDRQDIGGLSTLAHPDTGVSQVFVYDGHPGGVGIARRGWAQMEDVWARARDLIRACPCEAGCPSCVQSPKCGNNNHPLDKAGAVEILARLSGG